MKHLSFGIDIGGINTVVGLVDCNGEIYAETSISTHKYPLFSDYNTYIHDLVTAMRQLLNSLKFKYELVGIGIGAPNANYHTGTVEQPPNLWKSEFEEEPRIFHIVNDIKLHFAEVKYSLLTNDANAATIGEMVFGGAKGMKDFIMITLGTGLGSGFVANGEMIYGYDGFAGEMGHIIVKQDGRRCGCGRQGCLETYVSATGIKRTAFELMASMSEDSTLRTICYNDLTSLDVFYAAQNGDLIAIEVFNLTGNMLGKALADIAAITSPEAIFLFGGLAKSGDMILTPTRNAMESHIFPAMRGKVKVQQSDLINKNAAILGAAALVWQRYIK